MSRRRIITLEEHFSWQPAAANRTGSLDLDLGSTVAGADRSGLPYLPAPGRLEDIGEGRIADMDANGISMQVLSSVSPQTMPASEAIELARGANDAAAAAVAQHPDRFAAFAALPTAAPEAAADELSRCVEQLGFVGTLILGRTDDECLDAERFAPILARIARLEVPLYLHPAPPPAATTAENYAGFGDIASGRFQTAAWGWHNETAVHFLRLWLSGVFDRHPGLQVILGHWGELLPFFLDRIEEALPHRATGLERGFAEVMRQNVYVTPSGLWTQANLDFCVAMLGAERIMYSVDYPFIPHEGAAEFLESSRLGEADKDLIAHGNAHRVLGL